MKKFVRVPSDVGRGMLVCRAVVLVVDLSEFVCVDFLTLSNCTIVI